MKTKVLFLSWLGIVMMLIACQDEDNKLPKVENSEVVGTWYTVCESAGTFPSTFTGVEGLPYSNIGYYYVLNSDKTGWCATLYFEDGVPEPIYIVGGRYASFTYYSLSDGTISIKFDEANASWAEFFKNWKVRYDDSHVFVNPDEQEIRLDRVDQNEKNMIESWVADYNGGSSLSAEDNKTIIENSGTPFSKTYTFTLNNKIDQYNPSGTEDWLKRNGSIDLEFRVCPVYLQSSNGVNAGDYYVVKCDVTPHNNSLWAPYKENHFWSQIRIYGYWFKDLELNVSIVNEDGTPINSGYVTYFARPIPENANDSQSYTDGKTVSIGGTLSGGASQAQGLHAEGVFSIGASWTSSTSYELTTINSTLDSSLPDKVKYTYESKNVHLEDDWDKIDKNFPSACRTEFTGHSFWVWHIPYDQTGNNGVKDGLNKKFRIKASVKAHYSSWYHWRSTSEFDGNRADYEVSFDTGDGFLLPMPNRVPWGFIALKNATKYEMAHVKIVSKTSGETSMTVPGSFSKDQVAKGALPEGNYTITYDLMNPNTNVVVSSWIIDNVTVHQGKDEESATVTYSTTDAKRK